METKICKQCEKPRGVKEFSLVWREASTESFPGAGDGKEVRRDICHHCGYDGITADQKHLMLREAYRNYLTFRDFVSNTGKDVLEYTVPSEVGSDEYEVIRISFLDLERALKWYRGEVRQKGTVLSKRKEEAFLMHIIYDKSQDEVAKKMGITTVSVGQYCATALRQLARYYFSDSPEQKTLSLGEEQ